MKKILVTGGNGFLGNYVVQELLKYHDTDITILSNMKNGLNKFNKNIFFIHADIRNDEEILEQVKNFDSIYHIAGNIRTKTTDNYQLHYDINARGTLNILKACDKNNIKRFIFISTCEIYGNKLKEGICEDEKKEPLNDYAKSKAIAEEYCKEYAEQKRIKITVIRPSYIYGYGQYAERLFPRLIEHYLYANKNKKKNKKQKQYKSDTKEEKLEAKKGGCDFVYVKDAAKGIVLLGEKNQEHYFEIYNISSGKFTMIKEVFYTIEELFGYNHKRLKTTKHKEKRYSLSIEKAKKNEYKPEYDLKKSITDFIDCYKKEKIRK